MQRKAKPELPVGAPPGATARLACEVPDEVWLALVEKAADPAAWRPTLGRTITADYVVFFFTLAAPGRASEYAKFPRDVWLAWCRGRPTFPSPAPASETVEV
ncbi:hypothetical protein [Catenulispora pinistramenti]|nr:hypothetical protein [Catenulispora pinistramenti]